METEEKRTIVNDPVLVELGQAARAYEGMQAEWRRREADLIREREEERFRLLEARKETQAREEQIGTIRRQVEAERAQIERERERSDKLTKLLQDVHRALFGGNVYDLVLHACLTMTGATRGLYVVVRGDRMRIRAAVEVEGYPGEELSPFLHALCRKVLDSGDPLIASSRSDLQDLPQPERPAEQFQNLAAAPVVLLADVSGVVIVGDRVKGEFDHEDINALLSIGSHAAVALENARLRREVERAYITTVSMLADAIEAKDPYTHGHCEQVSHLARCTADELGLTAREKEIVYHGALLHDTGKIGVSDGVLNKPGPLLPEEHELIKSHVRVGYDLVRQLPSLQPVADVILHHHEWYDGHGYPNGLKGEEIPVAARIVGAVDAYCAMISRRSYKKAYPEEQAREELKRCAGTQFDPQVVDALLNVLDRCDVEEDEEAAHTPMPGLDEDRPS